MPALAIAGGTALSAGGSIFSGIMGKSAAKKQADAIRAAQGKAEDAIRTFNTKAERNLDPWKSRGNDAGNTLSDLLAGKLDPDTVLKASSLFKFQEQEGSVGINRELKARGLYGSGAGLESLRKFENQLVGEEGQRQYDRLFQISEQGRGAAATMAANDVAAGNALANVAMQGGVAAGGAIAQGDNAFAQGIGGALNAVAGGGMQYMNYKMLEPILSKLGGGKGSDTNPGDIQEALGRSIQTASSEQWYNDQFNNVGMSEGVTWASNGY